MFCACYFQWTQEGLTCHGKQKFFQIEIILVAFFITKPTCQLKELLRFVVQVASGFAHGVMSCVTKVGLLSVTTLQLCSD